MLGSEADAVSPLQSKRRMASFSSSTQRRRPMRLDYDGNKDDRQAVNLMLDGPGIAGRADGGRFCRSSPLAMIHADPFSQPSALPFAIRRPPRSSPYHS
jgi:hypothetical protein